MHLHGNRTEGAYFTEKKKPALHCKAGMAPSDPALPGHLPHLAVAKQGRLCLFYGQILPHSGNASNIRSCPFQGKEMRQEKSFGSFSSSREPYLWSPTSGKPRLENWTRIW